MNETRNNFVSCLIVGAGLAGMVAARELQRNGVKVLVFDKGRGVGGRLATRRIGDGVFDHGAQFFTVRDAEFGKQVEDWLRAGVVREWCRGFADKDGTQRTDAHPRYCGTDGMVGIAKYLAADIDVRIGVRVENIEMLEDGWAVTTDTGARWRAASLLLTAPVPQSLNLIESGDFRLDAETKAQLARISYEPCLAVLARYAGAATLPAPGAVQLEGEEPVSFIADNNRKGVSPGASALTIHAGIEFSRAHWEADDATIAAALTAQVAKYLCDADGQPLERAALETWQVKRWRYSRPAVTHPERFLAVSTSAPLIFAGDAFGGPRVEGAALSGLAAANQLAAWLL